MAGKAPKLKVSAAVCSRNQGLINNQLPLTASNEPKYTHSTAQTASNNQLHNNNRLLWGSETWSTRFPQPSAEIWTRQMPIIKSANFCSGSLFKGFAANQRRP